MADLADSNAPNRRPHGPYGLKPIGPRWGATRKRPRVRGAAKDYNASVILPP